MYLRIGKVTNVYPSAGKVKVMYEDERNVSLPLAMLTMNNEYSLPAVGDRVVTLHMANGSSKGFVLGTYYGGGKQPKANAGYRKDFDGGAYAVSRNGAYLLLAAGIDLEAEGEAALKGINIIIEGDSIDFKCAGGTISAEDMIKRLERIEDALGLPHTI